MSTNGNRQLLYIITAPLVELLRAEGFPMPEPPIRFYPDGSLWTDDNRRLLWSNAAGDLREPEALIGCGGSTFRPLAPFGGDRDDARQYDVSYPGSYDWMGEHENWALTYPGILKDVSRDEYDLSQVQVSVKLRRKFTPAVAAELAGVVQQWFADIGSKGVFGEAGVAAISPAMRYLDRCAGFELDARGSGQETLNTLYLAVLNWGMNRRRPLVLTDLTADRNEAVFASDQSVPLR